MCLLTTRPTIANGFENTMRLKVKPASCVALNKGQLCFQDIRFLWETDDALDYCLFSDTHGRLLFFANGESDEFVH
ncbi:MAG: hypothetical protein ACJAY2_001991 [Pseudomonadales bacterium]